MNDDDRLERYERMWQRRKQVMDEIAHKERRRERDAILRMLEDRKGDKDDEGTD